MHIGGTLPVVILTDPYIGLLVEKTKTSGGQITPVSHSQKRIDNRNSPVTLKYLELQKKTPQRILAVYYPDHILPFG